MLIRLIINLIGEDFEQENPVSEACPILEASNLAGRVHHPIADVNNSSHLENSSLIARARAVRVVYEFARAGVDETDDDRRKRNRRNQRRVTDGERRLLEVVGDLPPPPPAGSRQLEDNAYFAIRKFEVEQMTYKFSYCEVCNERRLEGKGTRNMCNRCRRDKNVPKVWSGENNMDPMSVPEDLSEMSDAEQMLIARLAPTVHVHMLKHGGIASRGHCIAFPQAVQEPAIILPRLPAEVDIIRVRRQGKDDTHKDFRVRRQRVEGALRWLKHNNAAYADIVIDEARLQNLPSDGELPNLRTVEFSETAQHMDDQGPAPQQLDAGESDGSDDSTVSGIILPEPGVNVQAQVEAAINLPEGKDPKTWLADTTKQAEEHETMELELPDVSPLSLNDNQRALVILVLHTLYKFVENELDYHPLRLVVSGTAGTGKSYVIKCLQRLVRLLFGKNDAVQVITPTGNSAYLVQGTTAHSFLGIPTGGRSCNELTVPSGPVLEKIQSRCQNLKVLIGDERSMFGRTTLGWMEQHARYAMNRGANAEDLWGGLPVVVLMGDDVQLPPVCDTPVYIDHSRSAPSNHGRLVWTSFDSAVELTQIVRQTESEQQLRDVLMSMRTYTTTPQQVHWLQKFQWHNLRISHGPELLHRMDEQGHYKK